jgi:hypothetical protein
MFESCGDYVLVLAPIGGLSISHERAVAGRDKDDNKLSADLLHDGVAGGSESGSAYECLSCSRAASASFRPNIF